MTTLSSTFCRRCCVIKEHVDKGMIRCGVPDLYDDEAVDLRSLPLLVKLNSVKIWVIKLVLTEFLPMLKLSTDELLK